MSRASDRLRRIAIGDHPDITLSVARTRADTLIPGITPCEGVDWPLIWIRRTSLARPSGTVGHCHGHAFGPPWTLKLLTTSASTTGTEWKTY